MGCSLLVLVSTCACTEHSPDIHPDVNCTALQVCVSRCVSITVAVVGVAHLPTTLTTAVAGRPARVTANNLFLAAGTPYAYPGAQAVRGVMMCHLKRGQPCFNYLPRATLDCSRPVVGVVQHRLLHENIAFLTGQHSLVKPAPSACMTTRQHRSVPSWPCWPS